jgi:archaellin
VAPNNSIAVVWKDLDPLTMISDEDCLGCGSCPVWAACAFEDRHRGEFHGFGSVYRGKLPNIVGQILNQNVTGAKGTVAQKTVNVGSDSYAVYVGLPEDIATNTLVSNILAKYASETFVAAVNTTAQNILYAWAPVKLSSGQHKVDLTPTKTVVSYWSPDKGLTITNAYLIAILTPITNTSRISEILEDILNKEVRGAKGTVTKLDDIEGYVVYVGLPEDVSGPGTKVLDLLSSYASDKVIVILNWVVRINDDLVLDPGEKVVFFVYYNGEDVKPDGYDLIKIEVKVPIGAPLTIERMIPPSLTQPVVDLG